jgi:hypothetical protein
MSTERPRVVWRGASDDLAVWDGGAYEDDVPGVEPNADVVILPVIPVNLLASLSLPEGER